MTNENGHYTCEICGAEFDTPGRKGGHKRGHQVQVEREELQEELRRLAETASRTPTTTMMNERGAYSAACVKRQFGSWGDALRSIGLTPNYKYDTSADDIKEDIKSVAETLGHPPTAAEQREHGEYCVTLAQNEFGSWNEALRAASFEPSLEKGVSKEVLLQEIHNLVDKLGKVPTAAEMKEHGQFSQRCYFDRWEGWQAAVRVAGYEPVGRATGPENYNWKEQPAYEWRNYGPNWDDQRAKTLKRDNYVCQTPGCELSMAEHRKKFEKGLHVHHIRPLSMFGGDDSDVDFKRANRQENLITVCVRHHHLWERASPLRLDTRS